MESVTFFAWVGDTLPSDEVIHISGGSRVRDGNGTIMAAEYKEARFVMGKLVTDDPETITVIRGMIKKGASYTEDKEVYLSHVLSPEKKLERKAAQEQRMVRENQSLREQLEAQSKRLKELEAKEAAKGKKQEPVTA